MKKIAFVANFTFVVSAELPTGEFKLVQLLDSTAYCSVLPKAIGQLVFSQLVAASGSPKGDRGAAYMVRTLMETVLDEHGFREVEIPESFFELTCQEDQEEYLILA